VRYVDNRPHASYRRENLGEEGADMSANIDNGGKFVSWFVRPFYVECVYSVEGGTLRDALIREESDTEAGWPGRTGRASAAAWRARREGEEINVGTESEEEGSEDVWDGAVAGTMLGTALDACGSERGSGASEGRTAVGGGVVGAGTAEKTGVVTLEDAVEEGADETGCSGSMDCVFTG